MARCQLYKPSSSMRQFTRVGLGWRKHPFRSLLKGSECEAWGVGSRTLVVPRIGL
ncbi:hypothetical protein IG631_06098 [Alternaria alternata]|nr:hypothetical protein IG631_06098 [Alternaria alternata]